MGALYSGCFQRRLQSDPEFRAADELVRALERRLKLFDLEIEGFSNRIRDPRSDFGQIADAQFNLDRARERRGDLLVELEAARENRGTLLEK
jgi:hypothetical protein